MKTGKSLIELATEIERQAKSKQDFIAPSNALSVQLSEPANGETPKPLMVVPMASTEKDHRYPINRIALGQIASRLEIPNRYMDKMANEAPQLLADNVNVWLQQSKGEKRLVRTLDGNMRAMLSNSYQRIDNNAVAESVLPVLGDFPGIVLRSSEITEQRLYMKFTWPKLQREVKSSRKGDIVEAGVIISNSEVGMGAVSVSAFAMFLWCTNGAVREGGKKFKHVGRHTSMVEETVRLSDDTRAADDRAQLLVLRDTLRHVMSPASFDPWIEKLQNSTEQKIKGDIPAAVEALTDQFTLTQGEGSSILRHLIEGGDVSRYGLMNAITRTAEDIENYDRATEFEAMGPRLLELPANDWRRIAEAA